MIRLACENLYRWYAQSMDVDEDITQIIDMKPRYMSAHVRLKSDFMQMAG